MNNNAAYRKNHSNILDDDSDNDNDVSQRPKVNEDFNPYPIGYLDDNNAKLILDTDTSVNNMGNRSDGFA